MHACIHSLTNPLTHSSTYFICLLGPYDCDDHQPQAMPLGLLPPHPSSSSSSSGGESGESGGDPFDALGATSVPIKAGSSSFPVPGYDIRCLDPETGEEVAPGELGQLAVKLPLPPGTLPSLWEWDDARYEAAYLSRFEGFYDVGDSGLVDEDGFVHILARTDDVRAPSSLSCSLLPSFLRSLVHLFSTMTLKIPHTHDSKFNHKS